MNRRSLLKCLSGLLAAGCAAVVAVPGVSYLFSALRRQTPRQGVLRRVARLRDLPVGRAVQAAVTGSRRDAWTVYPEATLGRVWLVRRSDETTPAEQTQVDVFSSVCPHLGCAIGLHASGKRFECPCHKAAFDLQGKRATGEFGPANRGPRNMDALEWQLVRDEESGEWWVEVKYEKFEAGLTKQVSTA